jgi:hypothetical protein
MLVIAHHFIHEPDTFWASAPEIIASMPYNLKLHSVFPSKDLKTGTCVWEAPNVGDVQAFLDNALGKMSKNECYEVNEEIAIGLPQKTAQEVLSS